LQAQVSFERRTRGDDDGDDADDDQEEVDDDGVPIPSADGLSICVDTELTAAFQKMGPACTTELKAAIDAEKPLSDDRRCQCFLKNDLAVAAVLDCKSMAMKALTVSQEFAQCVALAQSSTKAVCTMDQIENVMVQMDPTCKATLEDALVKGTTLANSTRCGCFMQINPILAKSVKCKTNELQQFTLAEQYAQCVAAVPTSVADPPICSQADVQKPFDVMDAKCVSMLADAIATNTPTTQDKRCACYEQVDDEIALDLNCMTMPAKKMTLAQEYQTCIGEGMSTLCTAAELFGPDGLGTMSTECKQSFRTARTNPDAPVEDGAKCSCYESIPAEKLLSLRCKSMKGSSGTVAHVYQGCVASSSEI